jgi:hypothetical protein
MSEHATHADHAHTHGAGCGHVAIKHEGHTDYLHEGHLCHPEEGQVEDHTLPVGAANPDGCTPSHACAAHDARHVHGPGCGHAGVPHGDHVDYLVGGHLHHPHGGHCDDHGAIKTR